MRWSTALGFAIAFALGFGAAAALLGWRPSPGPAVPAPPEDEAGPSAEVAVGGEPGPVVVLTGGEVLAVLGLVDHTVSFVRIRDRVETARVVLPVRRRDEDGEPVSGHLTAAAAAPDGRGVYAASTEGQIFLVDSRTGTFETVFDDAPHWIRDLRWDAPRNRLLATGERWDEEESDAVWALEDGKLREILPLGRDFGRGAAALLPAGDALWIATGEDAVWGEGDHVADLLRLDLGTGEVVRERTLPRGYVTALAPGPGGSFFVADHGVGRLLHFDAAGSRPSIRYTAPYWRNSEEEGLWPFFLAADDARLLVAGVGEETDRVYEYAIVAGTLTGEPVREYRLPAPGSVGGLTLPSPRTVAVTLAMRDTVLFLTAADATPFTGW